MKCQTNLFFGNICKFFTKSHDSVFAGARLIFKGVKPSSRNPITPVKRAAQGTRHKFM
jgi:hypothetical protein